MNIFFFLGVNMVKSLFANQEVENSKEELFSEIDIGQTIQMLRVQAFNKLKEFSERAGRRTIAELNQILDATELNEYIRMVYNDDHRTIDRRDEIRRADYFIEKDQSTGSKIIKASKEKGLSFCRTITQFVEVARAKSHRSKNRFEDIHVYTIREDAELPRGLAFNIDTPGHVSLIVTQDMSWNEMLKKLKIVSDMLEFVVTIPIQL